MIRVLILLVSLFVLMGSLPVFSSELSNQVVVNKKALILDGKSFDGRIRAKGIWGVLSHKGTIEFKQGKLIWKVNEKDKDYTPATYTTRLVDSKLVFNALMLGKNGDQVIWSGTYDGTALSCVTAKWKRQKGDWVHDTLLPDVVTMVFRAKAKR